MEASKVYEAIKAGDAEAVEALLADPDTDLTVRDKEGRGLLHHAVMVKAGLPVVKALLDKVDIALRDANGQTVLDVLPPQDAATEQAAEAEAAATATATTAAEVKSAVEGKVKELVLGAGEEAEKELQRLLLAGWTHFPVTEEEAKERSEDAVRVLTKLAEMKTKVDTVHKAVQEGREADLKDVSDLKLLLAAADHTGLSPLHKAVIGGQVELVRYFISEFTDVISTVLDNMGRTVLHYAAALPNNTELYAMLKEAGADDSLADLTGRTPTEYQQQPDLLSLDDLIKKLSGASGREAEQGVQEAPKDNDSDVPVAATEQPEDGTEKEDVAVTAAPVKTPTPPPPPEPAKPAQVKPVTMYVPDSGADPMERAPPPSTVDGRYVAQHLGTALTLALAEIAEKRPWDPIEYLGHWLHKYRSNMNDLARQKALLGNIRSEEQAANEEEVVKFKKKEEAMQIMEEERRRKEEEEAARKKKEQEELQRQAKEALLAQKPQLPTVTEEEVDDAMVRERDEQGQTELHLLAAQSGADLMALMNLGYSLADRDSRNKTPRDIAEEQGLTDNVEAIDNYVSNLLEQEKLETLSQLVVEGYDKLPAVLDKVSTEGLPQAVTDFVQSIPQLQSQVAEAFRAVLGGLTAEVDSALQNKALALAKDVNGRSPLHVAVLAGHLDVAKTIVQNFPQAAKARDNMNRTPLHYAAALSDEVADLLKSNGADTNAKDAKQHSPAYYKDEKEEIIKLKDTLPALQTQQTTGDASSNDVTSSVPDARTSTDEDGQGKDSQPEDDSQPAASSAGDAPALVTTTTTSGEEEQTTD